MKGEEIRWDMNSIGGMKVDEWRNPLPHKRKIPTLSRMFRPLLEMEKDRKKQIILTPSPCEYIISRIILFYKKKVTWECRNLNPMICGNDVTPESSARRLTIINI